MSAGDVKIFYGISANLVVTALASLASSSTHVAGWCPTALDNTTAARLDAAITAKIVVGASPSAGEIRMYLIAQLDDATWPDTIDGAEGAKTLTSVEIRDAIAFLAAGTNVTTAASRTYYLHCPSVAAVFNGTVPNKFTPFITQSSGQALAASGHQVTIKSTFYNVATA